MSTRNRIAFSLLGILLLAAQPALADGIDNPGGGGGGGGSGTVTTLSVVTANGFAGTVANPTTTPAITLRTSVTGSVCSNGTALSACTTTGTGSTVLATTPTLVTPVLGVATATTVNKVTLTAPATGSTLTVADGKTLTVSNTLTLTATDGSTLAIGTGGTLGTNAYTSTAYAPLASPTFTGVVTIPTPFTLGAVSVTSTGTQLNYLSAATGTTGTASTNVVFSTSPTLVTPALGVATATSLAIGGATPGANVLAVTGTANISSTVKAVSNTVLLSTASQPGIWLGATPVAAPTDTNLIVGADGTSYAVFNSAGAGSAGYLRANNVTHLSFGSNVISVPGTVSVLTGALGITMRSDSAKLTFGAADDIAIGRNAAGVAEINSGVLGTFRDLTVRWLNWAGTSRVGTQFDATTNVTLANVTNLTSTVIAGKTYAFRAVLHVTADAIGGIKVAIGGTATATAIVYETKIIANSTNVFAVTARQTALAGSNGVAADTSYYVEIEGSIVVNAGGTLTVQAAQNASNGTSSVLVGSTFIVQQF